MRLMIQDFPNSFDGLTLREAPNYAVIRLPNDNYFIVEPSILELP